MRSGTSPQRGLVLPNDVRGSTEHGATVDPQGGGFGGRAQVARTDGWNGLSPPGNDDPCERVATASATTSNTAAPSEPASDQRRTAIASASAAARRSATAS